MVNICLAMAHLIINLQFSTSYSVAKLRPLRLNAIQPNLHSRDFFCADNLKFQLIFSVVARNVAMEENNPCLHGEGSYSLSSKPWNRAVEHMDDALLSWTQLFAALLRINPNLAKF